ncbi:unnamed protein product [Didymodactylos carnosus]|uniref:Large ribosomal subunit protein P2 n=1 Tax=Didymodactylos carnosus TaxID=1234261 RepID=A0A815ZRR3_9BILA|nr:unnamed protein product [Didymodactylos carnosus]CAF1587742.1 unnamed protein product [Didymodactylos carnosus]CAF4141364.1 unnamed protein product [Didymodactylos carnosus]CAF4458326.1 unnamed protein product [Didymodactylos carnosus]
MRYAAAYLLSLIGGNPSPSLQSISTILSSVGIVCDEQKAYNVIQACQGKNVNEIIEQGLVKLESMSTVTTGVAVPLLPGPYLPPVSPPISRQSSVSSTGSGVGDLFGDG